MEQCLSTRGKEILIKAVAQAVPTYSMSCFKLPKGLCQHLEGLIQSFWWGSKEGKRKTCWVAWDDLIKPKYMGGLRFKNMEMFNLALLARQAWRVLQDSESLSARVLKAAYFPHCDLLEAELGSSPSKIWQSILEGKEVLSHWLIRRIGDGETTRIWDMNWLPRDGWLRPVPCNRTGRHVWVSHLIDSSTCTWNQQMLTAFLTPPDQDVICNMPLSTQRQSDFGHGIMRRAGLFLMLVHIRERSAAFLESIPGRSDVGREEKEWAQLWQVKVPSKIKIFLWRLA
ncbi:hypothetical protein U9M48_004965 [Paspalum notatum var. saurae]|uniref:Reverse transcriptase zinc-binding domain-containing protein n=1 Tax=Paspalum notatum var. saurae TaxID=547442 RepID=A0AAQ3PP28_PASNO